LVSDIEEHRLRVFENMVLRVFGPKRDGVTGGWRKLQKEELHNLYSSPNIIRMSTSRMGWAGHVAEMGIRGMHVGYWWESQKENHREDQDVDGWAILKWVLERLWNGMDWIDLARDRDR
jgi:hypothetical protein